MVSILSFAMDWAMALTLVAVYPLFGAYAFAEGVYTIFIYEDQIRHD